MGTSAINLGSTLSRTAHKFPQKTALVSHERDRLSYFQFEERSNRFANGVAELGIKSGDHIAILSLNCIEELIAFYGVFKMGGVVVPVNVRLALSEMEWILKHSDAVALFYSGEFEDHAAKIKQSLTNVKTYMALGGEPQSGSLSFKEILERGKADPPYQDVRGDDIACMVYTAGTTGRPKGVLLTHNSLLWNCVNWTHAGVYRKDDLCLQVFPLYHVAAIGNVLTYIYLGGTVFLKKTFDPEDCLKTIERERITRWAAAPTVFNMILQVPGVENYDTNSVTLLGSGAAIMPSETQRRLRDVFPKAQIFDTYGMTEASGGITTLDPKDFHRKVACVGKEHVSVALRLVDEKDREVPPGEVGEIIFRGNNTMKGYYKDPEATADAMKGGWMHTGDLGRLDEEGFLYIVDRKKDIIITGAENVYPREVEEVLYTHPLIAEAAVIGVPDPKWGETIKAVVTVKSGAFLSEKDVIDFCREKIAGFKCPKSVDFVDDLPKNPAGKTLKKDLRAQYENC